jgi:hypothetical protein
MLPGVAGAVQAQHNLLVDLAHFPHALNLRRLLHAQAQVSHEAARHAAAAAPELVDRILERQSVYRRLVAQSRNVGGVVGDGGLAVGQAQIAISRLQRARLPSRWSGSACRIFSACSCTPTRESPPPSSTGSTKSSTSSP